MKDKSVLITGGNAGLGLETAVALATMGAAVTITARDAARGDAARQEIIERSGADPQQVEVMALDLASTDSIRRFAESFLATHPRLDVLVNNAGLILSERTETSLPTCCWTGSRPAHRPGSWSSPPRPTSSPSTA